MTDIVYATILAECVTIPIMTIKTNYQNGGENVIRTIYDQYGLMGFYRSTIFAITSQVLSSTLKYNGYNYFKEKTDYKILAGIYSGVASSLITHPVDVVKIHYQMNVNFRSTLAENGLSIFYRGYSKSIGKMMIGSSTFLPIYDYIRETHPECSAFSASILSSILSTTLMHPLDYLKVRHIYGLSCYNGLNPLNYFKGLSLNLARIVPHFVITMTTIEYLSRIRSRMTL